MHLIEFTLACKYFYVMRKKAGSTIEMGSTFLIKNLWVKKKTLKYPYQKVDLHIRETLYLKYYFDSF